MAENHDLGALTTRMREERVREAVAVFRVHQHEPGAVSADGRLGRFLARRVRWMMPLEFHKDAEQPGDHRVGRDN